MKNLGSMMKQAQKMQENMQKMQAELENMEVDGSAGGGMVKVTLTGKGRATNIKIDPSMIGPDDVEMLEDLLVAAINDAKDKAEVMVKEKMSEMTGGLQLPPGMELPF
ncbi:MAG: YbaB/EbfC family nucleoid-associated protein [Alphaproteobacteria bacterium]|nr:YbaB/EbfC family nucleoid-associated protein [Rhodospirillales bacterium]MCW9045693.1 YbaB/EbfC family nucleoid-associated protein [Alphaproteobacteria bacterium]